MLSSFPPQNPFTDNSELQQTTARMLTLNTWDVAVALTNLDWAIFHSVHEVWLAFKILDVVSVPLL